METFPNTSSRPMVALPTNSENLVSGNLNLVEILVRQLVKTLPHPTDVDDLRQAGFVGLIEAARNFDADRGIQFDTFAASRVRGAMVDELRSRLWAPRSMSRRLRSISLATRQMEQEAGRSITLSEIASALNTTVSALDRTRSDAACARVQRLDVAECDDGKNFKMLGSVSSAADNFEREECRKTLAAAIDTLGSQEKNIIILRYGKGATQVELSEQMNVTASRISQIEAGAVSHLRSTLGVGSPGAPTCNLKVRRIGKTCLRSEPASLFSAANGAVRAVVPAGSPPTRGMRYLLESLPKPTSHRRSFKQAVA